MGFKRPTREQGDEEPILPALSAEDKEWLETQVNANTVAEKPMCNGDYVATLTVDFAWLRIFECPRDATVVRLFFVQNPKSGKLYKIMTSEVPKEAAHKDYPTGETYWGFPVVYSPGLNRAYIFATRNALDTLDIALPMVTMRNPTMKTRRQ